MPETSLLRRLFSWPSLLFGLLLLCVLVYSWNPLGGGDDFWAHAAIGRWTLENAQVPRRSLFLWSADIPWIFHAFGSGVVFAALLLAGGPVLALIFNAFASALPVILIWSWWRKNRPFALVFALFVLISIWVAGVRWHLRPEIFTVNFLTLLMLFFLSEKKPLWSKIAIVGMFALWPNMHGGVLMGIVVMWATALAETAQALFSKGREKPDFSLIPLAAISTLAVFLGSAYGFGYAQTWGGIGSELFLTVTEWKPFWHSPQMPIEMPIGVFLLCATAFVLWFKSPEKRWAHAAWVLLFLLAFLQARRQLWLVAVAALLVIAVYSAPLVSANLFRLYRRSKTPLAVPRGHALIARVGVVSFLLAAIFVGFTREKGPFAPVEKTFPSGLAQAIREAPAGKMFNDYEYSAALQWLLYGQREFYIDLINAYPPEMLKDYLDIVRTSTRGLQLLESLEIDVVALRPRKPGEGMNKLAQFLNSDPRWRRIYTGKDGDVWARNRALRNRNLARNDAPN